MSDIISSIEMDFKGDKMWGNEKYVGKESLLYFEQLKEWSRLKFESRCPTWCGFKIPLGFVQSIRIFTNSSEKHEYAYDISVQAKIGYASKVSSFLATHQLDKDQNLISLESDEEKTDVAEKLTEAYVNLLQNFGVIAALVISVLFPLVFTDKGSISAGAINYFSSIWLDIFYYSYLILVNISVFMSFLVIIKALFLYKHLTFWMPSDHLKLAWIKQTPIAGFVILGQILLSMLVLAIPFGAVVLAAGPQAGVISLALLLVIFFLSIDIFIIEENSLRLLHTEVQQFVDQSSRK
eukprot:gene17600-24452_t